MEIQSLVFHKIVSEQHKRTVEIVPRSEVVALPDRRADALLNTVTSSYERESFLAYAGFDDTGWFPTQLRELLDGRNSFYNFSVAGLNRLKEKMIEVPATTGGYLTYILYREGSAEYFMVILLKSRQGIAITSDLDLASVQSLELERLHFAAQIDLQRWLAQDPEMRRNHVSFLKGRARSEAVVKYFQDFLGIDEELYFDPTRHTIELVNASKNFVAGNLDKNQQDTALGSVFDYGMECIEKDRPMQLSQVAMLIYPGDAQKFTEYLREKKLEIQGQFNPVRKYLRGLMKFRVRTEDYYLSFEREAVNNGRIWINSDGQLVLMTVPDELKGHIPIRNK